MFLSSVLPRIRLAVHQTCCASDLLCVSLSATALSSERLIFPVTLRGQALFLSGFWFRQTRSMRGQPLLTHNGLLKMIDPQMGVYMVPWSPDRSGTDCSRTGAVQCRVCCAKPGVCEDRCCCRFAGFSKNTSSGGFWANRVRV